MVTVLKSSDWPKGLEHFVSSQPHPLVVVKFGAVWCGPCKVIAPAYHTLAKQGGQYIACFEVDVDESEALAVEANVNGLPTFVFYTTKLSPDGKLMVIDQLVGPTVQQLQDKFQKGYQIVSGAVAPKPPVSEGAASQPPTQPQQQLPSQQQQQQHQVPSAQQQQVPAQQQPIRPNDLVKRELVEIRNSLIQAIQRTERLYQSLE